MVWEAISKTRKSVSSGIQTPRSRLKKLGCASFFQPTSRGLDILMKHSFSCLIYYFRCYPLFTTERILIILVLLESFLIPWMMGNENFPSVRSSQKLLFSLYCCEKKYETTDKFFIPLGKKGIGLRPNTTTVKKALNVPIFACTADICLCTDLFRYRYIYFCVLNIHCWEFYYTNDNWCLY